MRYVKICPDGHVNDQFAQRCSEPGCGVLLGSIKPEPMPAAPIEPIEADHRHGPAEVLTPPWPDAGKGPLTPNQPGATPHRDRPTNVADFLVLQFTGGNRVFNVRSNQVLGRDDGSRDPSRVNIPTDTGVDVSFVSRWHCRFERRDRRWYVTPLDPADYVASELQVPNPTCLGSELLTVGKEYPVQHGDSLTLANVELRILIPGAAP